MEPRAIDLSMQQLKQNTFLKEKDKLLGFIKGRVSSLEEAEDILQDVFYQFVAGFETIESLDRVTSWLYSVARNKIIDRYRRDASRPQRTDFGVASGKDDEGPLTLQEILPDLDNSPESLLLKEAIWDEITLALDDLPAEQRHVFIQNEIEEKSFRELSEEEGVSINTLLSRKRYAIMALRKRLQSFYDDLMNDR
ncbi:MAG TPA: RNA polymerase sigma factor [Cyclobacteriaceae bacterium]|nr:RNA polymerase sigma factor [Cyclobacteriaceae bacterium]